MTGNVCLSEWKYPPLQLQSSYSSVKQKMQSKAIKCLFVFFYLLTNETLLCQLNSESPGDLLQLIILQQTESVHSLGKKNNNT